MSRPLRIHVEGALYYVTARGAEGMSLFRDDQDYTHYLGLLEQYRQSSGFKIFGYVLLPDSIELCLELTDRATISDIMHGVNSRYTKYVNRRYGRTGHVFRERFKSTILEKAPSLLRITGYLHVQPRRLGLTDDPYAYPWSSYPGYLLSISTLPSPTVRPLLSVESSEVLELIRREQPGVSYEDYLRSVPISAWDRFAQELTSHGIIGSGAFVTSVRERSKHAYRPADETHREDRAPVYSGPEPALASRSDDPRLMSRSVQDTYPHPGPSLFLTASLSVAILLLCAAGLYAKNLATMRQALRSLATEQTLPILDPVDALPAGPTTQLANFIQPSRLAGTIWQVQIRPLDATGDVAPQIDRLQFEAGKLTSASLSDQGFESSNYSLSVQSDGTILWETMQTGPRGDIICWRGEWDGRTMHGILTRQAMEQPAITFRFVGTSQPGRNASQVTSET